MKKHHKPLEIPHLHCLRCDRWWTPASHKIAADPNYLPKRCIYCKNPYWNKPRKVKK